MCNNTNHSLNPLLAMKLQTSLLRALTVTCIALTSPLTAAPEIRLSNPEIRPETAIEIYFDQAVVPQTQVNKIQSNKILNITPTWKGKIKWLSTNSALFLPSQAPQMGIEYSFKLSSGIKHLDGTSVPAKKLKKISSSHFKADYTRTTGKLESNRTPATYIRFNDDISPTALKKLFYYRNKENNIIAANIRLARWQDLESSYYIKPNWNQRFQNMLILRAGGEIAKQEFQPSDILQNGIIVTPQTPLPVGQDWKLHLKKSAPNSTTTQRTNTGFFFTLGNLDPFRISSANASVYTDEERKIYISFNSPLPKSIDPAALSEFISISPTPAKLKFAQTGSRGIVATGDFNQNNEFTILTRKGFPALNGLTQEKDEKTVVTFTHIRSSLGLPSYTLAQLSKGERIYGIDTVNMKDIHVRIKQLNTQQAIRALLGYDASYTDNSVDQALPYALISGTTIYDKEVTLDNPIDTSKNINFKWDDILPNNPENAILFLSVKANPKDLLLKDQSNKVITQSIIQLTDIGLAWKIAENKIWVYAYSCETGQPLANVKLSIRGDDAKSHHTSTTDKDGLCLLNRNQELDQLLVASLGDDTYIASLSGYIDTVSMWRFPVEFNWNEAPKWDRDLLVFTDRNLYKPAETVRVKGILREVLDNRLRLSTDETISYKITDPHRKTLSQGELNISDQGSFDLSFELPEETVGRYRIQFTSPHNKEDSIEPNRKSIFYHAFTVAEFRRNAFEITASLPQPEPNAATASLNLQAKYYQGTPISEGSVSWYFSATPTGFYPEKFRDFHFGDHREYDAYYWNHYFGYTDGSYYGRDTQHSNGKANLAADGSTSLAVDIPKLEFPTPQNLSFTSEVTDSRNQTLTNHSNTLVHPAHSYFGISRIDNLIRVGDQTELSLVHIDLKENYIQQDSTATISIQREYFEPTLVVDKQGKQKTRNEKRLENLADQQVTLVAGRPTAFPFTPEKPGRYIITIRGKDSHNNLTASASNFYVYGKDDYPWATEEGIRIKMVAEKKSYKAGDTARILVMTPIEGTALVTVERLGVMRHYRRELSADNPVIEVPISAEDAPNAYISVLVIRGRAESKHQHKAPALRLGFCKINVENTQQKLNIALQVEGQYHRPGDDITVSGKVTDSAGNPVANAEVILYAEDEGILSVMGYSMPKPLKFFYRPRPLTLRTGVSLGYFITEDSEDRYYGNKGFVIGGGGDDAFGDSSGAMPELKDKLRSNFDPCAFWMPTITTDANGAFTISSATPDTLTRYRIMALASSGAENFGSSKTSVVVSKDLMLEPATPRFANEGDHVNSKILVQNASKFSGTWDITLHCDSLTMIDEGSSHSLTKSVSLSPGDSVTLSYPVHFINTGETTWKWTATPRSLSSGTLTPVLNKRLSDSMETKFEINYPRPLLRYAETIAFQNRDHRLFGKAPKRLLDGRGEAQLELSNSLLLNAGAAFDFLLKYPYGCVEQTSSSMMPWFAATDLRQHVPVFKDTTDAEISKALQKGVNRLLSMQTDSGGLAYWPGGEEAEDWATASGGMALIMAKIHGANVPTEATEGVTSYLTKMVKNTAIKQKESWQNETLTRSLYVLALAGKNEAALINKFYQNRAQLSSNGRIYLALAIHHTGADKQMAIELMTAQDFAKDTPIWMRHRASKALQLLAWSTIAPKDPRTITSLQKLLDSRNKLGHWRTTWVNGWSLNAMATYARNVESELQDITITLNRSGKEETIVLSKEHPSHSLQLSLEEAAALSVSASGKVYANVRVAAKPTLAPAGAESHKGVKITRRYQRIDAEGKATPLTNPRIGDLVRVSLDITFPSEVRYVVIDDALPSVMETVNGDFASQSAHIADPSKRNWQISRRELRSDRAIFFINKSWRNGTQTISYLARITSSGTVHTPAAKVEAMYDPSVFGLTAAGTITVEP